MRMAAIYDIHANLPALEAAFEEISKAGVDAVVVGGDVVPGPMPQETIAFLLSVTLPLHFISGNGEAAVLELLAGRDPAVPQQYRPIIRWTAEQLRPHHQRLLATWPKTLRFPVSGLGEVLFCHATPRSDREIFTRATAEERLLPAFAGIDAPVVVCGHTHMQFDRMIGGIRVVNAGSVGMPFGEPGAYWLVLGPHVQLRRTTYDFAGAAERIRNTTYPQAADFAHHNILQPTLEEKMLELFGRAELR